MIGPAIRVCAVPARYWTASPRVVGDGDLIQDLIADVLATSRRMAKPLGSETERLRFDETSELLEQAVLRRTVPFEPEHFARQIAAGRVPVVALDPETSRRLLGENRPATIAPPEVQRYLESIDGGGAWRDLASLALESGCGLIEALVIDCECTPVEGGEGGEAEVGDAVAAAAPEAPAVRSREEFFNYQVARALANDSLAVNASTANHVEIVRVLARWVVAPGAAAAIRLVYADGSEARAFPLRCLPPRERGAAETQLRVGLMSMRHLQLDALVDWYWFRNREIDQSSTLGRADEYCYLHSVRQLEELRCSVGAGGVLLRLYHTGFEPAVVGFYRAVTESLCRHPEWIRVEPMIFGDGDGFAPAQLSWPPLREA